MMLMIIIIMMMMVKLPGCVENAKGLQLETKSTLTNCKLRCIRPVEAIHTVGPKNQIIIQIHLQFWNQV